MEISEYKCGIKGENAKNWKVGMFCSIKGRTYCHNYKRETINVGLNCSSNFVK